MNVMPHELDRPGQLDTYQKIMQSTQKWIIVEAPTGSGKSAWPAQAGHSYNRTISVVRTKSLQHQYENSYGFKVVKGKNSYDCADDTSTPCDICHVTLKEKDWCKRNCDYYVARREAMDSNLVTLNYSKFVLELGEYGFLSKYEPDLLFLDEAHEISDIVCDHSGFQLQWNKVRDYVNFDPIVEEAALPVRVNQCKKLLSILGAALPSMEVGRHSPLSVIKEYRKVDNLKRKIGNTLRIIDDAYDWYASSDSKEIILKPLTAKYHFKHLFDRAEKVVMMSATIGNPYIFTKELGIEEFEFIKVPNPFPAATRRVVDMQAPRMGYNSTEADRQRQAEIIAYHLNQMPESWSGIILTASKAQSRNMQERLSELIDRPIWLQPDNTSTEYVLESWTEFYQWREGAVGCTWAMWEGCDLGDNQFVIVAKTPFPVLKQGTYDQERYMYDVKNGQQRISNKLVQGLGRVRRGKQEHLGSNKFVGIADGNWTRIRKYIDVEVLASITT